MIPSLLDRATPLSDRLVELRRDLHRHPELAYRETRTSEMAAREVEGAGFQVRRGVARTGVVAELAHGDGPTVALRADMDALPIHEESGHPWASGVPGVMHACGHDAHTAMLTGAARILSGLRKDGDLPPGRVRLLFQPSEEGMDDEGKSGARRMVEEGVMEGVDGVVGLHVGPHLPSGRIHLDPGPFFAGSDEVRVTVHGRSAHAARAHEGVDAVVLASQGVISAQQIVSRRLAPQERGVLTLAAIHGGQAPNIVADRVRITGTLRYFEPSVRTRLRDGVRAAFSHVEAFGGRSEVEFQDGYPPVVNDPELTRRLRRAFRQVIQDGDFLDAPASMASEDFGYFATEAPGAFFWLGASPSRPRELHHPEFDIDEGVLPLGAALLAQAAVEVLRNG